MEATKKTSTTKAALLVIAALSMLLSGLFIATASRSDASPPPACPDGFSLTADAKNCFQAAVITSADNPNSCDAGQLTPDGSKCYVAARVIPQEGKTECPKGYSPDDSLGGMCARFEPADQKAAACPDGARGVAGACYILVAKGPAGTATCTTGVLQGDNCVITGTPPVPSAGSCPTSSPDVQEVNGECFRTVTQTPTAASCVSASGLYGDPNPADPTNRLTVDGLCKYIFPGVLTPAGANFNCPDNGTLIMVAAAGNTHMKAGWCQIPTTPNGNCPNGTTAITGTTLCKQPVGLTNGALVCPQPGYSNVNGKCIIFADAAPVLASCPTGSAQDAAGECRKPVADATGAFYCKNAAAALNGKSCVYTAGFSVIPAPTLYKCDSGARTVIGAGSAQQVICILGDANANTTTGPSCLQGVLSTDSKYCIVPRIDTAPAAAVAAPVPSFTG